MPADHRVAVIGGGITGLTAAWTLCTAPNPPKVTLLEAGPRLGGKLHTEHIDGVTVELGADAFVGHAEPVELVREVGLGGELVTPDTRKVWIRFGGRVHPLPAGLVLGVPTRLLPLARSSLISRGGAARAALDLILPRQRDVEERSIGALIRYRFGREVLERLVEPFIAGVYAGDVDQLELAAATPDLAEAARTARSLMRALGRAREASGGPTFLSVAGGLRRLVEALAAAPGLDVRLECVVRRLEPSGDGYVLERPGGWDHADAVIVAVPAPAAAALLRNAAPDAAAELDAIPYASVATITLVYPPGVAQLAGSGVLVPRVEGGLIKAATWVSQKWAGRVDDGRTVIRASVGRHGEDAALQLDDDTLVLAVHRELRDLAGSAASPVAWRVTRWGLGLPQYVIGHGERVAGVRAATRQLPGVELAGAAYEGVGIAACVRQGRRAAARVLGGR
ncbi:MAG: protoporphyrinogen oxidase [Actinomycetota bacterium]|nr:protoporphyrinogen oxidase [Actinomycetota bacterium]